MSTTLPAPPLRGGRAGRSPASFHLTGAVLWLCCTALILLPLAAMCVLAVRGDAGILLQPDVRVAGLHSAVTAGASAAGAVALGTVLAIVLDRTDLPGRGPLRLLALSPLLVPPFVGAIAWTGIAGPTSPLNLWWSERTGAPLWSVYGPDGVIVLLIVHSYPLAMVIVSAALRRIPSDLEQAARIAGAGPLRTIAAVTLPLLRPAMLSSFVLIAVGNLADFGIPAIVGLPEQYVTLSTLVYRYLQSATVEDPLAAVSMIGVVLLAVAVGALLLDAVLGRRGQELDGSSSAPQPLSWGRARPVAAVAVWIPVAAVTVLPLLALLGQALLRAPGLPMTPENLSLESFERAITTTTVLEGALNSVLYALGAAVICGALGLGIGVLAARGRARGSRALLGTSLLPLAIPGIVIAVGWLILAPRLGLFNTPWLILAAYVTSFTALVVQAVRAPLAGIPAAAEEAARISGAGPMRSLVDISCRMAVPAAVSGAVLVAVTAVRELTLSVLLLAPGSQTLGVAIFSLQQAGSFSTASALSFLVAVIGIGVITVATRRPS